MIQKRIEEIANPSPDQLDQINSRYDAAIRETLVRALAEFKSPIDVFSKMRGVFPSDIAFRDHCGALRCGDSSSSHLPKYHPELHALDYEWYFTNHTARKLSQEFASKSGLTIFLGAPKVAAAAIQDSRRVVFIDKNPRVLDRFPVLVRSEEVHLMDAVDAGRLRMQGDVVVFDSPWYLPDIVAWLLSASQLAKPGGLVVFALYPPLLRPTAALERDLILEIASSMGSVQVEEEALVYETPLFEQETLDGSGLSGLTEWRRADVVRLTVRTAPVDAPSGLLRRPLIDGAWKSFIVGNQVVKIRSKPSKREGRRQCPGLIEPVGANFLLQSVSVRGPERELADLWTSRNRVACSSQIHLLCLILRRLARGERLRETVHSCNVGEPAEFEQNMREFLAMEA